ncbi:hypothetical protein AX774_g3385 [Zancudomyces culisetae]|uniref:Uncharacterized protein n=1 Tax=Zancudomyces culisetae TaxID=1213189 RepID=A0A1R1PQ37_ZANCU|nr:hypothetical protein AX774_g3385 [Zancudomyces culisetae]|eukprot:OMH83105.1 hypothetical protein AX774_g3385 [Zancudomyces culisetae]
MSGKGSSRKPSPIDTNRPKEDGYLDPSGYAENGYENGKTADTIYPKSPHFFDFPTKFKRKSRLQYYII